MADQNTQMLYQPPEIQDLNRQQRMAQMLLQQGQNAPQGQMISGHYVAPSWTQNLANIVQTGLGVYGMEKADKMAEALRKREGEDIQKFYELQYGTPSKQVLAPNEFAPRDDEGNIQPIVKTLPGVQANPMAAYQFALSSPSALLRNQAIEMLKPQKLGEGETIQKFNPATGQMENIATGGSKLAGKVKEAAQLLGINKPLEQWTPQERNAVDAKVHQITRAGATNVSVNTGQRGFQNILEMKNAFKNEPIYKAHQEVQGAYNQIDKSLREKTPIGDVAAATKIMKLLDPGSVVRESELGMALNATGLGPKLANLSNSIINGQKLNPQQREDFRKLANQFYNSSVQQYNTKRQEYANVADEFKINPNLAVGNEYKPVDTSSSW